MPPMTTLRTLVQALQSGQTETTRALDRAFSDLSRWSGHQNRGEFKKAGAFSRLPNWAKGELGGLQPGEFDHMDDWPTDQKDGLRATIDKAIEDRRKAVHFFWKLGSGKKEAIEILDPDAAGDITVTFVSPRQSMRVVGDDDVAIDVGTAAAG
jgi:hypothetical protein